MNAIKTLVRNGRIEAIAPSEWPEGCEVRIEPAQVEPVVGMREEDWPTTPEGIAEMLKRWDAVEPLEMTPQEEADLAAWRSKIKAVSLVGAPADFDRPLE